MENITMKNILNKSKSGYGVGEWAEYSYNIGTGCINNCRYCYARDIAVDISMRSNKPMTREDWSTEQVKTWKSDISQKASGVIMLPSMHDITETYLPTYLDTCWQSLKCPHFPARWGRVIGKSHDKLRQLGKPQPRLEKAIFCYFYIEY
jgi:hypothetical protein